MNIRIDKFLGNMGIGTRTEIKKYIKQKLIMVDGEIIKSSSIKIDTDVNEVRFNNRIIEFRDKVYLMMNKPQDVISATYDNMHETVIDLLDEDYHHFDLFPMGRLDIDTEGLLILTNDGKLSHRVLSPKHHVNKTYYAEVDGQVLDEHIEIFEEGIDLEDFITQPATLQIIHSEEGYSEVHITISEGKFHQVKRMVNAIGMNVTYLKRLKMGGLELDETLELGEYRELEEAEIKMLLGDN